MLSLLLFGAGHGIGALLLDNVVSDYRVTLLLRNEEKAQHIAARYQNVNIVLGDASDPDAVEKACQTAGSDATSVSTMGSKTADYQGHRLIIDCAEKLAMKRMLLVTSLGCGDSWATLSNKAKVAFGHAVREKSLAETWLQTSMLDYCIIRPGGLKEDEATGKAQLYQNQETHGLVHRQDVANTMTQLIEQPTFGNQIYAIIDPTLEFKRVS